MSNPIINQFPEPSKTVTTNPNSKDAGVILAAQPLSGGVVGILFYDDYGWLCLGFVRSREQASRIGSRVAGRISKVRWADVEMMGAAKDGMVALAKVAGPLDKKR